MKFTVVGAGLSGSIIAHELAEAGHKVTVLERSNYVGGEVRTECIDGIIVHKFGAHIFRTNSKSVWDYINKFGEFNSFINSPIAVRGNKLYNLPFNMNTFYQLFGIKDPTAAKCIISRECAEAREDIQEITNFESWALCNVGKTVYDTLIKDYTEKQWGMPCRELPATLMSRVPIRYTYDNNYYAGKRYQGVPVEGYTNLITSMLNSPNISVVCGVKDAKNYTDGTVVWTGSIDEYYDFCFGELGYRTLHFVDRLLATDNYNGAAVVNNCDAKEDFSYTRIIEHRHFMCGECKSANSVITFEFPERHIVGKTIPHYPIPTRYNADLYDKYRKLESDVIFAGKLGTYSYTDMEQTVIKSLELVKTLIP